MLSRLVRRLQVNKVQFFSDGRKSFGTEVARQHDVITSNILKKPLQGSTSDAKIEKISKAMKSYLERANAHDDFMKHEKEEFELGKRHLKNIMGWNHVEISQKDIDLAIEYLMPSGLFDKKARPVMKPPEEIYPKKKEAEFDITGRPFHTLFYTGRPNFYQIMHEIHETYKNMDAFEDKMIANGQYEPAPGSQVVQNSSQWLTESEIKPLFLEKISSFRYKELIHSLERLAAHPYSILCVEFLMKFRKNLVRLTSQMDITPLTYTEDGIPYANAEGIRKHCVANVTVWGNGTGKININGDDLLYFKNIWDREQIMVPLIFTNLMGKVDIDAKVEGVGTSSQSGAIRFATSLALRSFVDEKMVEDMRLAGLLTKDRRISERKKPGQEGARRSFAYRKR